MTFTAAVSPSTASGAVTFIDDATILSIVRISAGQATFSTSLLAAGTHSIFAYYDGQTSAPLVLTVRSLPDFGFRAVQTPGLTSGSEPALVADFNGDGIPDLGSGSKLLSLGPAGVTQSLTLTVLLGNGDGTFRTTMTAPLYGPAIAVGDFNGDGIPDIAVLRAVYLGKGDGTFQAPLSLDIPNG